MIRSHVAEALSALAAAKFEGLDDVGQIAEQHAKELCPVRTGRLQASIRHKVSDGRVIVGSDVEYAPDVELGTQRQRAQPYIVPAVTEHVREYKDALRSSLSASER